MESAATRYLEDLKERADFSEHRWVARIVLGGGEENLLWIKYLGLLEKRSRELARIRDRGGFGVFGGSHWDALGFGLSYVFAVSGTREKKLRIEHGTVFLPAAGYEGVAEGMMFRLVEDLQRIAEGEEVGFELKIERTIR